MRKTLQVLIGYKCVFVYAYLLCMYVHSGTLMIVTTPSTPTSFQKLFFSVMRTNKLYMSSIELRGRNGQPSRGDRVDNNLMSMKQKPSIAMQDGSAPAAPRPCPLFFPIYY